MALHGLAQPLSAAALSIETASLLLERDEIHASQERLHSACDRIDRSSMLIRVLKIANGAAPSPWGAAFDPAMVLNAVWSDLRLAPMPPVHGDRLFLEAALTGLALVFAQDASRAKAGSRKGGEPRIELVGRAKHPGQMAFWIRAIRKTGIQITTRSLGEDVRVVMTLTASRPLQGRPEPS